MSGHPHGLHQVIDRAGRDALHIGFLDHRGEGLLCHPPRFEEAGEVVALAQLRNAQLDGAGEYRLTSLRLDKSPAVTFSAMT